MATCGECKQFFRMPQNEMDYEEGKGDCVREKRDQKGQFWLSKTVFETEPACEEFRPLD
jgi:hypothetical protein